MAAASAASAIANQRVLVFCAAQLILPCFSSGVGLHSYDRDIFSMSWGPTVSALSYVFDKSHEQSIIQKSITGYR